MRYRRVDSQGDMIGIRTPDSHLKGAEAVAAAIRSRILSFYGEWWEDPEDGIPLEALIGRMDEEREQVADAMIRSRVMGTPGVLSVEDFRAETDGRKRIIFMKVLTEFGQASLEVGV